MMKGESMIIYVIFSMNEQQQQQSDIYTYTIECAYISYFLLSLGEQIMIISWEGGF